MSMNITDEGLRIFMMSATWAGPDDVELLCSAVMELTAEVRRLRDSGDHTECGKTQRGIDKVEMLRDRPILTVVWHDAGVRKVIQVQQVFPRTDPGDMLEDFCSLLRGLSEEPR